jgi:hypothetical protein
MLIIALVLAVIGLAALVFAVVTSNELVAWVCIAASVLGVVLLIIDALQERQRRRAGAPAGEPVAAEAEARRSAAATGRTATGESGSGAYARQYEDYPEDDAADEDSAGEVSSRVENSAGASEEPGGSDEYDHGNAVGDDTTR